jgi:TnpA family transposase
MSADFLTDSQVQNYGRYAAEPNEVQLARYFHLDERDLDFVNHRRGRHNRLGIALQLTTARFLGTFINDAMQIPAGVRHYVAAQLGIPRPEILSRYAQREHALGASRAHQAALWVS